MRQGEGQVDRGSQCFRVEIIGLDVLDLINTSGKGAVFISGHFANWEIMPAAIVKRIPHAVMTYRALNNPHIDKRIADLRHDYGTAVNAPKGIGTRELMRICAGSRNSAASPSISCETCTRRSRVSPGRA